MYSPESSGVEAKIYGNGWAMRAIKKGRTKMGLLKRPQSSMNVFFVLHSCTRYIP